MRLRDKFGRIPNLAVCESDYHDVLDRAQWSFVAIAGNRKTTSQILDDVTRWVDHGLDAFVSDVVREEIA